MLNNRTSPEWEDWRWHVKHAVRRPEQLISALDLSEGAREELRQTAADYPLRVTPYYLSLARTHSPDDPILRQCIPDGRELTHYSAEPDPLAEERDSPLAGLVHRYPDRVLVLTSNRCAVHCRHCMRKRYWGRPWSLSSRQITRIVDYLSDRPAIREVVLSGGDPLLLSDVEIGGLLDRFLAIPHVEMVRIGSRVPAVLPQRITPGLCRILEARMPIWLATHFNHPLELTERAGRAIRCLLRAGVSMVNQTVLLKGVNDDVETLRGLFTGLLRIGVKPYYLFHGDPVRGTMHFRTGIDKGLELMRGLRAATSGLALPAFALDLPGGHGKVRLEPECEYGTDAGGIPRYPDADGGLVSYPDCPGRG